MQAVQGGYSGTGGNEVKEQITVTVERGIPIPPSGKVSIEQTFSELLALEKGDSFVIPKDKSMFPLHVSIAIFGIKNQQRHEVRELENGDFRVWRTE
jgi:uncharacterized protein (DUF2249 family)